jgi:hypothetical protein
MLLGTNLGSSLRSLTKIVFNTMPLRNASPSRLSPSIATIPPLSRACPANAALNCFTRAFVRLVMISALSANPISKSYAP